MSSNLILDCFKKFIVSDNSSDMFVTGRAGTGKTTDLSGTIEWCKEQLKAKKDIGYDCSW